MEEEFNTLDYRQESGLADTNVSQEVSVVLVGRGKYKCEHGEFVRNTPVQVDKETADHLLAAKDSYGKSLFRKA